MEPRQLSPSAMHSRLAYLEDQVLDWEARAVGKAPGEDTLFVWYNVGRMCFSFPRGSPHLQFGWDEKKEGFELASRLPGLVSSGTVDLQLLEHAMVRQLEGAGLALVEVGKLLRGEPTGGDVWLDDELFHEDVTLPMDIVGFALLTHEHLGFRLSPPTARIWEGIQDELRRELPLVVKAMDEQHGHLKADHELAPDCIWWWKLVPALVVDARERKNEATGGMHEKSMFEYTKYIDRLAEPSRSAVRFVAQGPGFWSYFGASILLSQIGQLGGLKTDARGRSVLTEAIEALARRIRAVVPSFGMGIPESWSDEAMATIGQACQVLARAHATGAVRRGTSRKRSSLEDVLMLRCEIEQQVAAAEALGFKSDPAMAALAGLDEDLRVLLELMKEVDPAGVAALSEGTYPGRFWWYRRRDSPVER